MNPGRRIFFVIAFLGFVLHPLNAADVTTFNAEDIEEEIRIQKPFLKAYSLYVEARAGDAESKFSYSSAADAFINAVTMTEDRLLKMRALWYAAFCYFLDFREDDSLEACNKFLSYFENFSTSCSEMNNNVESGLSELASRRIKAVKLYAAIKNPQFNKIQISVSDEAEKKRRLCISIISDFAEMMAFSPSRIMSQINQAVCVENLHVTGAAFYLYVQDHEGKLPPDFHKENWIWQGYLFPYTGDSGKPWKSRSATWVCPSIGKDAYCYGFNHVLTLSGIDSIKKITHPEFTCLIADSVYYRGGSYPHNPSYDGPSCRIQHNLEQPWIGTIDFKRHMGGANILFADGHVEWRSADSISNSYDSQFWSGESR